MFHLIGDYSTPDIIQELSDVGGVALALTSIAIVIGGIGKFAIWFDKRRDDKFAERVKEVIIPVIQKIVTDATYPIQEDANGGYSLADLHKRFDRVEEALNIDTGGEATNESESNL